MINSPYLTQDEAAKYLRVSARTLERHRVAGSGCRFCRAGRRILYRREDLDAYLSQHTYLSTAEAKAT